MPHRPTLFAALVLFVVFGSTPAAPAPLPKHQRARPAPVSPFWEIDFSPLTAAGQVNLGLDLSVNAADGSTVRVSLGQGGRVQVGTIIDVFAGRFGRDDLVIDPAKTRMTFKSLNGARITSVELKIRNLEQRFAPIVLPPGNR